MASQTATTKLILSNANPPSITLTTNPDFLAVLIESLNSHLQSPITYTNDPKYDTDYLITKLGLLTREVFLKAFSYAFSEDHPSPRNLSRPCRPFAFTEFISCPQSCPQLIEAHINTRGSLTTRIPPAYARRVASDLYESVKKCFHSPNKGWQIEIYHRVYGEDLGILPNWAVDAVWVWQLVTAIDWNKATPTKRSFLLLYYAGVGYATKEMSIPYT